MRIHSLLLAALASGSSGEPHLRVERSIAGTAVRPRLAGPRGPVVFLTGHRAFLRAASVELTTPELPAHAGVPIPFR